MNSQSTRGTLAYWAVAVAGVCLLTANGAAAAYLGYLNEVVADSPIAFYRMDDTSGTTISEGIAAANGIYQPNDGSSWLGGTLGVAGAGDGSPTAASFNGSTGYGQTADAPFDFDVANGFTLEAWVKTTGTSFAGILGKYTGPGVGYFMTLLPVSGQMQLLFQMEQGPAGSYAYVYTTSNSAGTLADGNWHHVVATHSAGGATSSSLRLYVDGFEELNRTEATVGTLTSILNNETLRIGDRRTGDAFFNGEIDEVAMYGSALSADRILAHFSAMNTPEPSTAALLGLGAAMVALYRRKRR